MQTETIQSFLNRGGRIHRLPPKKKPKRRNPSKRKPFIPEAEVIHAEAETRS